MHSKIYEAIDNLVDALRTYSPTDYLKYTLSIDVTGYKEKVKCAPDRKYLAKHGIAVKNLKGEILG